MCSRGATSFICPSSHENQKLLKLSPVDSVRHIGQRLGLPYSSVSKESAGSVGDPGLIPGSEDPLEKEMATHFSTLAWRISMDRGVWQATVHGGHKSWT